MTRIKPITKPLLVDKSNIRGFVKVDDFNGEISTFSVEQLSGLCKFAKFVEDIGVIRVRIGLTTDNSLLVFIGDDDDTAFAIAPLIEEKNDTTID